MLGPTTNSTAVGLSSITLIGWSVLGFAFLLMLYSIYETNKQNKLTKEAIKQAKDSEDKLRLIQDYSLQKAHSGIIQIWDVLSFYAALCQRKTCNNDVEDWPHVPYPIKAGPETSSDIRIIETCDLRSESVIEGFKNFNFIPRRCLRPSCMTNQPYIKGPLKNEEGNHYQPCSLSEDRRPFHQLISQEINSAKKHIICAIEGAGHSGFASEDLALLNSIINSTFINWLCYIEEYVDEYIKCEDDSECPEFMKVSIINENNGTCSYGSLSEYDDFRLLIEGITQSMIKANKRIELSGQASS